MIITPKTKAIWVRYDGIPGSRMKCIGEPLVLPGWEDLQLFIDQRDDAYVVTEVTSGCKVSSGTSIEAAKQSALDFFNSKGRDLTLQAIEKHVKRNHETGIYLGHCNVPKVSKK
jgi:hypothetical protein